MKEGLEFAPIGTSISVVLSKLPDAPVVDFFLADEPHEKVGDGMWRKAESGDGRLDELKEWMRTTRALVESGALVVREGTELELCLTRPCVSWDPRETDPFAVFLTLAGEFWIAQRR